MTQPSAPPKQVPPPPLDAPSADFLRGEIERLQNLYVHMDGSAQSVFNFYLTFVSTAVGAIIVLIQLGGGSPADALRTRFVIVALLFFVAIVGSVYLSALSGRYGHMARYARAIDDLRRYLIQEMNLRVPESYAPLLPKRQTKAPSQAWSWAFPTGTYQLFIGVVNGTSLALVTALLLGLGLASGISVGTVVFGSALIFVIAIVIYNVYSHWVMRSIITRLHVQINTQDALPGLAGRQ